MFFVLSAGDDMIELKNITKVHELRLELSKYNIELTGTASQWPDGSFINGLFFDDDGYSNPKDDIYVEYIETPQATPARASRYGGFHQLPSGGNPKPEGPPQPKSPDSCALM